MKLKKGCPMLLYRALLSALTLLLLFFTGGETERLLPFVIVFILGISAGLILLKSTQALTAPFLLLCLLLIFCYDSYSVFIRYVFLVPLPLAAIAVHIVRLKPKLQLGRSFLPLVAVAIATVLGGIGMITVSEYFRPVALFYVFGLGPGLVLIYLLLKNELRTRRDERSFLADLMTLALTAAVVVSVHYLRSLPVILSRGWTVAVPQWSNNIGTLLMLSFPAFFVRARHDWRYVFPGLFTAAAAIFCGSNGALILAGVELLICLFYLAVTERRPRYAVWNILLLSVAAAAAVGAVAVILLNDPIKGIGYSMRSRVKLLQRGWQNFLENPIFGAGIGYLGNADIYSGKTGTANWYHLFVMQVLGGLGVVGVLAWGYQLIERFRLAWRSRGRGAFAFALCYLGLLLMTQINPGEFCPVPYAFLSVAFFVLLERYDTQYEPIWHKLKKKRNTKK